MQSLLPDWHVGQTKYTQSKTSTSSVYTLKHPSEDVYSCSCPAWIFSGASAKSRTCKHLREVLGTEFETVRTGIAESASAAKKRKAEAAKLATHNASAQSQAPAAAPSQVGGAASQSAPSSPSGPSTLKKPRKTKSETVIKEDERAVDVHEAIKSNPSAPGPSALLMAHKFEPEKLDPKDYWISEKLDGVRAYWDGHGAFWSRNSKQFVGVPDSFINQLPRGVSLDGEFWLGRDRFDELSGLVRRITPDDAIWQEIKYMVFDVPSLGALPFEDRQRALSMYDNSKAGGSIALVTQTKCESLDHLFQELDKVQAEAGEGLMLRQPRSSYESRRHRSLLKVKTFYDAEARVVAHEPGMGKYTHCTGSLVCEMESGKRFSVGSGLTDQQRINPPSIGSIITYRFQNLTKDLVPRFPTYHGVRSDMDEPKDAFESGIPIEGKTKQEEEEEEGVKRGKRKIKKKET